MTIEKNLTPGSKGGPKFREATMRKHRIFSGVAGAVVACLMSVSTLAAENIRIGLIEPLSGPIAAIGSEALDNHIHAAEQVNKRGGVLGGRKLEIIGLDNAMKAEKTT